MKAGLVSVVLPIYNVERYLDRCIESVVNQTYRNLEIILVDDGSPDGCPKKCEEWAKKDERIKVVHKVNAGLGYARNTGIENASGEYICFFDSDDYIAVNTIEKAYETVKRDNADVGIFGFSTVDKNGNVTSTIVPKTKCQKYVGQEVLTSFLPDLISWNPDNGIATDLRMSAWTALYSMKLIQRNAWRFVSEREIISEDVYSLLDFYHDVKTVVIIPEAFYFYCENETSLTHSYKKDRYKRIKYFYEACISKCDQLGYSEDVKRRMAYPFTANSIAAMKMIVISDISSNKKKKMIGSIVNDETMQKVVHKMNLKRESITRKFLLFSIKYKMAGLCYWLLRVKVGKFRG